MKKRRNIFFLLICIVALFVGCGKVEDIKVTSFSLKSITPTSLRSVRTKIALEIDNPVMQFTLSDINGILYHNGEEFAYFTAEPLVIARKKDTYTLNGEIKFAGSIFSGVMTAVLGNLKAKDFTVDIYAKAKSKLGFHKALKYEGLKLDELIENAKND